MCKSCQEAVNQEDARGCPLYRLFATVFSSCMIQGLGSFAGLSSPEDPEPHRSYELNHVACLFNFVLHGEPAL
jgi:hypothetical protein